MYCRFHVSAHKIYSLHLLSIVEVSADDCLVSEVETIATVSGIITEAMNNIVTMNPMKHKTCLQRLRDFSIESCRLQTAIAAYLSTERESY